MSKNQFDDDSPLGRFQRLLKAGKIGSVILIGLAGLAGLGIWIFLCCRIDVPSGYIAVLMKKTGQDIGNDVELVPAEQFGEFKGLQGKVLSEGRYFYNPWNWQWDVVPQVEIPENKLGVRIRLHGDELGYGNLIADAPGAKGIDPEVLRPGRYPINALVYEAGQKPNATRNNFAELVELHEPVVIPAGYKGVVTLLSAPMPKQPNVLLVEKGARGVQKDTLDPGVYYINPYVQRISMVDCRSQRFDLNTGGEMGFPSRDGFFVTLDGRIEFRVVPDRAAEVFVTYNDKKNDVRNDARVEEEIIQKIILPNARSFCRLKGSSHSGREFILGEKRLQFQKDFQKMLEDTCRGQGIEIVQALITRISPPQQIALPVRERQIAAQQAEQYLKQIEQQVSEKELRVEQEMVKRKEVLVEVEREVVKLTTEAKRQQEVAVINANQRKKVAETELGAAQDQAEAILALGKADADVIQFGNEAEAAGWKQAVSAYAGDGNGYARWVLLRKLAPSFKQMMVNTADSPLMQIFEDFNSPLVQTIAPVATDTKAATEPVAVVNDVDSESDEVK
jgi:regulator of protease activity HflC (stomatin/prohibitin superfamily)